jgi:CO/xanthine dehydrogenase Mo-binding subunit
MLGRSFPDWGREGVVDSEKTIMLDRNQPSPAQRNPWNKGLLIGQKRPLKPKDVWSIRVRLQLEHRARDLAMFNLAIDSKLRGCDLVRLQVDDVCAGGRVRDRATVIQKKTGRPVQFEITEQTRAAIQAWLPEVAGRERAEIRFEPDGRVALVLGTQSNGQGHETSFAQIAADLLGLPLASFRFVQVDTRAVKSGKGHGGARSMHMGGTALYLAAQMVLSKARAIAAHLLQADASEVSFSAGRFTVVGSEHSIDLPALAEAARDPANLPDGVTPGLDADAYNNSDVFTFPNGCHAAEIEIDPETGAVTLESYGAIDDYGRLINPMLTMGQVQGGVAQGIGQALLEHTVYGC